MEQNITSHQIAAIAAAAQFRVDYLRWLAANLRGPEGTDIVIRKDAANAILQLIGDIE